MNAIYHHGVKDMHWGIRRYQYRDGTLTPLGKRRRAKLRSELARLEQAPEKQPSKKIAPRRKTKVRLSSMSDTELSARVSRLQKEAEYKRLTAKPPNKTLKLLGRFANFAAKRYGPRILDSIVNSLLDDGNPNASKNDGDSNASKKQKTQKQ